MTTIAGYRKQSLAYYRGWKWTSARRRRKMGRLAIRLLALHEAEVLETGEPLLPLSFRRQLEVVTKELG